MVGGVVSFFGGLIQTASGTLGGLQLTIDWLGNVIVPPCRPTLLVVGALHGVSGDGDVAK
jgi:hypothetical protein